MVLETGTSSVASNRKDLSFLVQKSILASQRKDENEMEKVLNDIFIIFWKIHRNYIENREIRVKKRRKYEEQGKEKDKEIRKVKDKEVNKKQKYIKRRERNC